ncbi:hypothetical protein psyc5s11_09720 [Clostridium gelidum]|uniref:Uncharacterized protein n=1 Tax=Clostridium gelidum TaxID=704125 RepID=A0ABM7SZ57_9CLOT|nr:hypothetical protein [Clostridium gelidum]BCZ44905.1 hypothetical protein psyc5s11_09720 [Clostridium gelidum]
MPNKNRNNIVRHSTMVPIKRIKTKKETILIEVEKNQVIGEFINGFEVIKPVKRYGKYYILAKNK